MSEIEDVIKDDGFSDKIDSINPIDLTDGNYYNQISNLVPYRKGDKWGFCNQKKQVIIPCVFDYVDFFENGIAKIGVIEHDFENIKIKYGLINTTGKLIAPCIYDNIGVFSQGLASVCIENQYGFINVFGKIVVPICYDDVQMFCEDLARVKKYDKYGFISQDGVEVIPLVYDSASEKFSNGIILVRIGGVRFDDHNSDNRWEGAKWKFIDKTGAEAITTKDYDVVCDFQDGYAIVEVASPNKYNKYYTQGVIDQTGKEIIDPRCDKYTFIHSVYKDRIILIDPWKIIDFNEKVISEKDYDWISAYREDYAIVTEQYCVFCNDEINSNYEVYEKNGFINKEGEEIIPVEYDEARLFNEGLAMVGVDEKYGFINCHNCIIIPLIYDYAESFCEGLAMVKSNEKFGFVNKSGSEVIRLKYEYVSSFSNGFAKVKLNGRSFYINKSGIEYCED